MHNLVALCLQDTRIGGLCVHRGQQAVWLTAGAQLVSHTQCISEVCVQKAFLSSVQIPIVTVCDKEDV